MEGHLANHHRCCHFRRRHRGWRGWKVHPVLPYPYPSDDPFDCNATPTKYPPHKAFPGQCDRTNRTAIPAHAAGPPRGG